MKKSNSSSGDYDSTKAYFDIERDVRSTKFKVASIAAEDMSKTESLPVGAEAEKAPPIKPLKLLLILVAAVIVIALIQLIPSYVASRYPAFEYNEEYELPGRSRLASSLEKMAGWGVDTAIPATNGQELTFTVPSADKPLAYDTTYEFFTTGYSAERFQPGDEITTNFQNCDFGIGNGSYSGRYVVITSDGGKDTGYLTGDDLAELYLACLRQNDLQEEFEAETGEPLTLESAEYALGKIDRQAFDMGIYRPNNYPYNEYKLKYYVNLASIAVAVIVLLAMALRGLILRRRRKNEYLRRWNEETRLRREQRQNENNV